MKFGKHIQSVAEEWAAPYYLNYKDLKKIIKGDYEDTKTVFFFRLERELEKINEFYSRKEQEFQDRLKILTSKRITLQSHDAFMLFQKDLAKLQRFVQLNQTGFRKILKKWDKRSHAHTKEIYLSRKIDIQPCFNPDVLANLASLASQYMENIDKSMGIESPAVDLRENLDDPSTLEQYLTLHTVDKAHLSNLLLEHCCTINTESLKILLKYDLDLGATDDISWQNCLHKLAGAGRIEVIKLIGTRFDSSLVNNTDINGRTPLHYATMAGHMSVVQYLIERGADAHKSDQDGNSSLIYAIIKGHPDCSIYLIESSPENEASELGRGLSVACQHGRIEVVMKLISKNAPVAANPEGLFPLHLACREGYSEIVKLLIANGHNIEERDLFNHWTPIFFCAEGGQIACMQILLDNGAKLNITDDNNWSPIAYSIYRGYITTAEMLENKIKDEDELEIVPESLALGPSQLFNSIAKTTRSEESTPTAVSEIDLDNIPSLSLPPPIIPLRV